MSEAHRVPGLSCRRRPAAGAWSPLPAPRPSTRKRCLSRWLLPCVFLSAAAAWPQALHLPSQPAADFAPQAGAQVPLDAVLRDESGAAIRLGAVFGHAPVVLVPGYYTCPNLCTTLFEGVLQALALSGMEPGAYRLVGFSIDPRDGAAAAAAKRAAYAALLPGGAASVRMLTGDAPALARIETALGYRAVRDNARGEWAHAAGFVVADAGGRITHYFPGVRFDPAGLGDAVAAAGGRGGGKASFGERLLLLCSHYNPAIGLHTAAAMTAVRAGVLLVLSGFGVWLWRRHGQAPHGAIHREPRP